MKKLWLIALLLPISVFAKGGGHGGGHSSSHGGGHSSHSISHAPTFSFFTATRSANPTQTSKNDSCVDNPKWYQFAAKKCN